MKLSYTKIHGWEIQDVSTSISIEVKIEKQMETTMKLTNVQTPQIVETRKKFQQIFPILMMQEHGYIEINGWTFY